MTATARRLAGLAAFALAVPLVLTGCGEGTGDLTGTIMHKGKAVASGSISAVGADGIPHGGSIGPDGRYTLTGLPVGEVKITVVSPNPAKSGRADGRGAGARGEGRGKEARAMPKRDDPTPDPEAAKNWFPVPDTYADIARTPLRATVKRGPTAHDIDLP